MTEGEHSRYWDDLYRKEPDHVSIRDCLITDEIEGLTPGSAVDLGCGTGGNAIMLAGRGWRVTGIDWSERAIEIAGREAARQRRDVDFIVADITAWSPPERFDLVICMYSLVGGETTRNVLMKASELLAPGGTLLVSEWDVSMSAEWDFDEGELYSPERIASFLTDLTIEKAEVRRIQTFDSPDDPRAKTGLHAHAAFVRARRE